MGQKVLKGKGNRHKQKTTALPSWYFSLIPLWGCLILNKYSFMTISKIHWDTLVWKLLVKMN